MTTTLYKHNNHLTFLHEPYTYMTVSNMGKFFYGYIAIVNKSTSWIKL